LGEEAAVKPRAALAPVPQEPELGTLTAYMVAARPWSFTMTAISVTLGVLVAAEAGVFRWALYLSTLVGLILAHAATNMINDYFDTREGVDRPESPTARYREHPILTGRFRPGQILTAALVVYAVAVGIGLVLAALRGWVLAGIIAVGVAAGVLYSGRPLRYKHHALGELSVFLMWGPLMVGGTYFIQTSSWQGMLTAVLASLPQGLWVALVLFANNLKDIGYDEKTGVRTIANLVGRRTAQRIYVAAVAAIYLVVVVEAVIGLMPLWTLVALPSLTVSLKLARHLTLAEEVPADADPRTAQAGMVFGLLLIFGYLLQQGVPL
jgi:1,4-dihydroxy-2-naphthoate octaprenyltransferase